jgi:hypothetical protein
MLTSGPAFLAESNRSRACDRRLSVQQRRNQHHSIRSANTTSRDRGWRFHTAAPAAASATDTATAASEPATLHSTPLRGMRIATSAAGATITRAVLSRLSGR